MIVVAIILVIASIAIPNINQARMAANETAAVRQIGTIHAAQAQYLSQFDRYAHSLGELGPPSAGGAGASGASLIPESLASGTKNGYKFSLTPAATGYAIHAEPVTYNGTGRFTYYSDETLITRRNRGQEPATAQSPELK